MQSNSRKGLHTSLRHGVQLGFERSRNMCCRCFRAGGWVGFKLWVGLDGRVVSWVDRMLRDLTLERLYITLEGVVAVLGAAENFRHTAMSSRAVQHAGGCGLCDGR